MDFVCGHRIHRIKEIKDRRRYSRDTRLDKMKRGFYPTILAPSSLDPFNNHEEDFVSFLLPIATPSSPLSSNVVRGN